MELIEILNQSIPNAGPKARAAIAEADRKLSILSGSDPKRATALKDQAIKQISSRDNGIQFTLADISKLHGSSLGRAETQSESGQGEEQMARSIEQLVNIADSRNISIPPAILKSAANAYVSKNKDKISSSENNISKFIDDAIKIQQNEQKSQVELGDGSLVLVGSQSGTRYDNTGAPIPSGNRNEQFLISSASEAYSPRTKEVMSMMGGGNDLVGGPTIGAPMESMPEVIASPESYVSAQKLKESEDVITRDIRRNAEAYELYKKGDRIGALNILRALKTQDVLGGITDASLDDYFRMINPEDVSSTTPQVDAKGRPVMKEITPRTPNQ